MDGQHKTQGRQSGTLGCCERQSGTATGIAAQGEARLLLVEAPLQLFDLLRQFLYTTCARRALGTIALLWQVMWRALAAVCGLQSDPGCVEH